MNKVFVTGADGMLGSSVCRALIKQNYQVKAFCLSDKLQKNLADLAVEVEYGNILNKASIEKGMQGCDYVIHVAASTAMWPRRNSMVRDVNITGTINVMEAAKVHHIKRMIHIGTANSFKHGSIQNPGDEIGDYDASRYKMDYMDSKFEIQNLLLDEYKKSGFPILIINPTYMIGPFDALPSSGKMIIGIYKNKIPGYTMGGKNFVCSQDVATAAVNALSMGRPGECYIAGNKNLTYKDFFIKVNKVIGKKFELKEIPSWLVLAFGGMNSLIARMIGKKPEISYGLADIARVGMYFTAEKARKELAMPQTPIEEGIKQCIDWFKKNNYLE